MLGPELTSFSATVICTQSIRAESDLLLGEHDIYATRCQASCHETRGESYSRLALPRNLRMRILTSLSRCNLPTIFSSLPATPLTDKIASPARTRFSGGIVLLYTSAANPGCIEAMVR
mmetsp:Transcript_33275/g.75836  ORF Transcript_33275/g.75836 Transcript_33275/m.75836 type:complete len:118 (+) Transcript_33275:73-426(+)